MKKIVPFKKEIIFKSNLSEITSISLEHSLHYESDNLISGEFIISGDYRMNDDSVNTDDFSFNIPFDINMDEKYILDKAIIDINDFYYEIINSKVLSVNIEVSIDKLEEKPLIEEPLIDEPVLEHHLPFNDDIDKEVELENDLIKEDNVLVEERTILEEKEVKVDKKEEMKEKVEDEKCDFKRCVEDEKEVKSLFDNITSEEEYSTYRICIVRESDSLESIMMKYSVTKEQMELYNDLKEIKIGDKLIIPSVKS